MRYDNRIIGRTISRHLTTCLAFFLIAGYSLSSSPLIADEPLADSEYFSFGQVFRIEKPKGLDKKNPHHVAQYSVFLCKQGFTKQMIEEMGHVERDEELGKAFLTFLREFGPDLEKFKDKDIYLKFHGFKAGKETSTWYYYLTDAKGKELSRKPWVSLHRSNHHRRCALTGIFLNLPGEEKADMPGGLKTKK